MIDFEMSEEQKLAQSAMQDFAHAVLKPAARPADTASRAEASVLNALWSTGIVQSQSEPVAPGAGRGRVLNSIMLEELAAADATLALALAAPMAFVQAVIDHGTAAQRESLLARFESGAFQPAALAYMEPRFGFDAVTMRTTAARKGEGWVLDGAKCMVPLAASCTHFLVVAQCEGKTQAFVVARDQAGVAVAPPAGTLGLRALQLSGLTLNKVVVPESLRLGGNDGVDVQRMIDSGRAAMTAIFTGACRSILEYVIPYTKERVAHGTALARKQAIAFRIADMHMDIAAMRWLGWRAAWELETGRPATRSAQLALTYATERSMWIADEALQAFGGHGYVRAHPIEMWYRNVRSLGTLECVAGV